MPVLGFDTRTTNVDSGFKKWNDGWYLLQLKEVKIGETRKGDPQVLYISECIEAQAQNKEFEGQKFYDRILSTQRWFGRHMELGSACCGSKQALTELMADFDPEKLIGRYYYAFIVINGDFNNVNRRVAYTEKNRNLILTGGEPDEIPETSGAPAPQAAQQPAQQPAPAPTPAPAPAPQQAAPAQQPVQQPPAPPAQQPAPAAAPVQQPPAPTLATGAPTGAAPALGTPPAPAGGAGIPPAPVPTQ